MAGCCTQSEYRRLFNRRVAAKDARRYRRRGLTGTAHTLMKLAGDVRGSSVLDVGGGIGAIELALLEAGAARATTIEISGAYETEAEALIAERGLAGRIDRRIGDFVTDGASVVQHDVVVLHRVVCCYPDYERLLGAAAQHAGRLLVFSYPPRNAASRLFIGAQNLIFSLLRREFRTFAHPPSAMLAVLAERGLRLTYAHHTLAWQQAGLERPAAGASIRSP